MTEETVTQTVEEIQAELDRTRDALKKANASDAARRKKLEEIEAAELTESEKLKKELADEREMRQKLEAANKQDRIRTAVLLKATELGFEHPQDAVALADLSKVEIAEDGKVSGFENSLEALLKSGRLAVKKIDGPGTPRGDKKNSTGQVSKAPVKIKL